MPEGWQPKLLALDIDGTLLKWVEGTGQNYEVIAPALYDVIQAAVDAGAHIVLASGRSPHGMVKIADLLDLPREGHDRLWIVASNGAVIFRYPPLEVVHEETFDASEAVRQVLEQHPEALVAVEERGIGYRVNRPFPDGELSGDMIETELHKILGEPVSRVIIRDPNASADDFVAMAARLGLHGTDYVVGWTAWLDLSPVGVSKASGLEYVARQIGLSPDGHPRDRRRPQRHRDAPLGRQGRGDGPGRGGGPRSRRREHRDCLRRRSGSGAASLVLMRLPETVVSDRLALRLVTPEDAEGMLAGRRRVSWHPDYPRRDDQDAAALVKAGDPHDELGATAHRSQRRRRGGGVDRVLRCPRGRGRRGDRGRGRLRARRRCARPRRHDGGPQRPAGAHRSCRRTHSRQCAAPRTGPACECWRAVASPSCAGRTTRASW